MRLIKIPTLPAELWQILDQKEDGTSYGLLDKVTDHYILALSEDKQVPLAVLGVMPGSLLSSRVTLWFSLFGLTPPTVSLLRESKILIDDYFAEESSTLFQAEILVQDSIAARFAEFYGFIPTAQVGERITYERII